MTFETRLTEFYIKRHKQLCARMARFTSASPETCEDLVHNVYESCLRYKHTYRGTNFVTYVLGVAKNIIANYFKYGRNYWSSSDQWVEFTEFEDQAVPADQLKIVQDKYMKRKLMEFISSLPPRQRLVAELKLDDVDVKDIRPYAGMTQTNITSMWTIVVQKGKRWMHENNLCWRYCVFN